MAPNSRTWRSKRSVSASLRVAVGRGAGRRDCDVRADDAYAVERGARPVSRPELAGDAALSERDAGDGGGAR